MSKKLLECICKAQTADDYAWTLYFFKIDNRGKQPYMANRVRFKNEDYLLSYVKNLLEAVGEYQVNKALDVQIYDGMNTKLSCDKLALSDALISDKWKMFREAIACATGRAIEGRINGYVLVGQSKRKNDSYISLVKMSSPFTKLENKKSVVFKKSIDNELDLISDDVYRLYLSVDFIVCNECLYAFTHSFESLFGIEKTLIKHKQISIDRIIETNIFSNADNFKFLAQQYKSTRTFITLSSERLKRIQDKRFRTSVATMLNIGLDSKALLMISSPEEASLLIRYLCYKIFQENETKDVLEASTVTKLDISGT